MKDTHWVVWAIPMLMLGIAAFDGETGYFGFQPQFPFFDDLRIVVSLASGWIAVVCFRDRKFIWAAVFAVLVDLFNPIIFLRVHLEKDGWLLAYETAFLIFLMSFVVGRWLGKEGLDK
jgi:hypothetical protein